MNANNNKDIDLQAIFKDRGVDPQDFSPRERILRAAYETILDDQISGTRLRKIAKNAGIAQGHLHYYFSSKDELLLELLDRLIQSFSGERLALLDDTNLSAAEKIATLFEVKIKTIKRGAADFVLFDFWVQSSNNETIRKNIDSFYRPWREAIDQIVQSGIESGEFSPRFAAMLPSYLISIMDGAALQYLIDDRAFDLKDYFNTAHQMIMELLRPNGSAGKAC